MKNLIFFSNNKNKIYEIKKIFKSNNINTLSLNDFPQIKSPKETGKDFMSNAKIKSLYGYKKFGIPCFADDSGICIRALNNRPGINSKNFLKKFKSKKNAFEYIVGKTNRLNDTMAYFKTSICLTLGIGRYVAFEGKILGNISQAPMGNGGFGYDPVFIPWGFNKTYAQMTASQKNKLSHRGIAINKLINFLSN